MQRWQRVQQLSWLAHGAGKKKMALSRGGQSIVAYLSLNETLREGGSWSMTKHSSVPFHFFSLVFFFFHFLFSFRLMSWIDGPFLEKEKKKKKTIWTRKKREKVWAKFICLSYAQFFFPPSFVLVSWLKSIKRTSATGELKSGWRADDAISAKHLTCGTHFFLTCTSFFISSFFSFLPVVYWRRTTTDKQQSNPISAPDITQGDFCASSHDDSSSIGHLRVLRSLHYNSDDVARTIPACSGILLSPPFGLCVCVCVYKVDEDAEAPAAAEPYPIKAGSWSG